MRVDVILPALNEEQALPTVLAALPRAALRHVVVVDNGSTDRTAEVARQNGVTVVSEPRQGYGRALWTGVESLAEDPPDVVAFLDADAADDPSQLPSLLEPIERGVADLVLGTRMLGTRQPGSMGAAQVVGNHLVPFLLRQLYDARCTDLGPMRAIRYEALMSLGLKNRGMGFTVEMQILAAAKGLRTVEVPVGYRRRIGRSKISGTWLGAARATIGILCVVARHKLPQSWRR